MTTEPVTLEQKQILHILRNPWGKTEDEKRRARLEGADEIEQLQRALDASKSVSWWRRWICAWRGHSDIGWLSDVDWQCRNCRKKVRLYGY